MKALAMIFAVAVTMMATTSHAKWVTLPCGKVYSDQGVSLTNNQGVLNASNLAAFQPRHSSTTGQAGVVDTNN